MVIEVLKNNSAVLVDRTNWQLTGHPSPASFSRETNTSSSELAVAFPIKVVLLDDDITQSQHHQDVLSKLLRSVTRLTKMGAINSTLPAINLSDSIDNTTTNKNDTNGIFDDNSTNSSSSNSNTSTTNDSLSNSSTNALMGAHPPPLYDAALIGNWSQLLYRLQTSNNITNSHNTNSHTSHSLLTEVLYQDKSLNSALHLACRRQPPPPVIAALLRADTIAVTLTNVTSAAMHQGCGGNFGFVDRRITVDGLTALHFACYCGAASQVVDMLIAHDDRTAIERHAPKSTPTSCTTSNHCGVPSGSQTSSNSTNTPSSTTSRTTPHHHPTAASIRDRRGRTPLHCACSGFRTVHRPSIIRSLLRSDPQTSVLPDEKGRTPLSLMYADYAEEIEEVLQGGVSVEEARRACGLVVEGVGVGDGVSRSGDGSGFVNGSGNKQQNGPPPKLEECWIILGLLLRAAHLGSVPEEEMEADELFQQQQRNSSNNNNSSSITSNSSSLRSNRRRSSTEVVIEEEEEEEDNEDNEEEEDDCEVVEEDDDEMGSISPLSVLDGPEQSYPSSSQFHINQQQQQQHQNQLQQQQQQQQHPHKDPRGLRQKYHKQKIRFQPDKIHHDEDGDTEVDLNYTPFQILHAASACIYSIPRGFFHLILKVVDGEKAARERDSEFRLPLHLAVRAMPPPPPVKSSSPVNSGGNAGNGNFGSSSTSVSNTTTSNLAMAIERGNTFLGRHLPKQASSAFICSSISTSGPCSATSGEISSGRMCTLTSTFNGQAVFRYSDGIRLTIHYRGGSSSGGSSSSSSSSSSVSSSSTSSSSAEHQQQNQQQQQQQQQQKRRQYRQPQAIQPQQYFYQEQTAQSILISTLLDLYPEAASIPDDETGKYPLLSALESGKPYREAIEPLVEKFPMLSMEEEQQMITASMMLGNGGGGGGSITGNGNMGSGNSVSSFAEDLGLGGGTGGCIGVGSGLGGFLEEERESAMDQECYGDGGGSVSGRNSYGHARSCSSSSSAPSFVKAVHASLMVGLTSPNVILRNETAYTVGYLMKGWVKSSCVSVGAGISFGVGGNSSLEEEEDGITSDEDGTTSPPEPLHYHNNSHSYPSSPSYKYQVDDFLRGLIKASNRYGSANARMGRVPNLTTPTYSNVEDDDPYHTQHRRSTMNTRNSHITEEDVGYRNHQQPHPYHTQNRRSLTTSTSSSATDDGYHTRRNTLNGGKPNQYLSLQQIHYQQQKNKDRDDNQNDEWSGIQSSMLRALASAMTQAPKSSIRIPDTPKIALDAAYSMLRHEDGIVRDGAAQVVAAALQLLDSFLGSVVVGRVVLGQKGKLATMNATGGIMGEGGLREAGHRMSLYFQGGGGNLGDSHHSITSAMTSTSTFTMNTSSTMMRESLLRGHSSINRQGSAAAVAVAAEEPIPVRHGRAVACYRILSSPAGEFLHENPTEADDDIFHQIRHLIRMLLVDESHTVRKAACLCIGPILSFSSSSLQQEQFSSDASVSSMASSPTPFPDLALRDIRPSILKCMRTTEDPDVHLHLARGLISAAQYHNHHNYNDHQMDNKHYFVTRTGTPILEGALMLASSSPVLAVRNLFGAFLWVALGMDIGGSGGRQRRGEGLARYMELAEGENGKIMMGLVTKTLVRIDSVREGGW